MHKLGEQNARKSLLSELFCSKIAIFLTYY